MTRMSNIFFLFFEGALDEKFRPILEKEGRDAFVYGSSPLEMSAELFEAESTQIEEVQKANAFVEESNSKGRTTVVDYPSDIVIRVKVETINDDLILLI